MYVYVYVCDIFCYIRIINITRSIFHYNSHILKNDLLIFIKMLCNTNIINTHITLITLITLIHVYTRIYTHN